MSSFIYKIIQSWADEEGNVNTTAELLDWIRELNETTYVNINECSIGDETFWYYDAQKGEVRNRHGSFFSIIGMCRCENGEFTGEQPVILQPEIGYLGIICREIDGVLNFLMQAKIEPGNVNCVQISPTIQATKSNFTQAHGGKVPTYFELFQQAERFHVIYDQIQSEQAARFYKKRNRNMIMIVDEEFEIYPNFRWMTLGQIKKLMEVDNLVNMDTRTVLAGIPLVTQTLSVDEKNEIKKYFSDETLFHSIFSANPQETLPKLSHRINNYKMFSDVTVEQIPLNELSDWTIDNKGICCKKPADFMVRYYDIEISGREVRCWSQPLFKAIGMATFALITRVIDGKRQYLVRIKPEIGSFDKVELGPTIQWEPTHCSEEDDIVETVFRKKYENNEGIIADVILSEEGGRFYHEQNKNIILEICDDELPDLPEDYLWADYAALNYLVQVNNCLNIQLRNLLSLIKI